MSEDKKATGIRSRENGGSLDRRNFMRRGAALGLGAAAGPAALLAGINKGAAAEGEPIPVGQAVPLSGFAAADGIEFQRGLQLACEEINAAGGILGRPLEPVFEDTGDMGDDVVIQTVQRLIDRHGVHAIINGYNYGSGTPEHDVVADAGIILVHYNTVVAHNELVKSDPDRYFGVFQGDPPEYWYGPGFLAFLDGLEKSGQYSRSNNKMAVVTGPGVYSANIANTIRQQAGEYGWEINLFETVTVPISQWGPTLAKIRQDPPAVIAVTHYFPQDLAQFMRQFAPDPTPSLVYMQYGPSLPAFREIGGESVNGVIYGTVVGALQDEIGQNFAARYKEKFGPDASHLTASQPYDGCYIWAIAAALAGGTGEPGDFDQNRKVASRIMNLIYRGVNGGTRFIPNEQSAYTYPTQTNDPSLGMPHQFLQIQDHTQMPTLIAPPPYDTGRFVMPPWIKA
jgi:branched-chain amino acid transport system substrate-binding protein